MPKFILFLYLLIVYLFIYLFLNLFALYHTHCAVIDEIFFVFWIFKIIRKL